MSHKNLLAKFGSNVQRLRESHDLSRQQVSDLTELTVAEIESIESGQMSASFAAVRELAHALSVKVSVLYEAIDDFRDGVPLAARIRDLRMRRNWDQATLAEKTGIPVAEIDDIESDRIPAGLAALRAFAAAFDLPLSEILDC